VHRLPRATAQTERATVMKLVSYFHFCMAWKPGTAQFLGLKTRDNFRVYHVPEDEPQYVHGAEGEQIDQTDGVIAIG
jgi:hypothetical protein